LGKVGAVAAGFTHSVALKGDGKVVAWGPNKDWDDKPQGQSTVPPALTGVAAIAAGDWFTVALKKDGTVAAWGKNDDGQCSPPPGLKNVSNIAAGR
jgi:alpha-tubulin suppressor-like RCC1 family protein